MMEKFTASLKLLYHPLLQDENISKYLILQICYEIIFTYFTTRKQMTQSPLDGEIGIELLAEVLNKFNLTDEHHDYILQQMIKLMNEGSESPTRMIITCFPSFCSVRSLLIELFRPIPKALTYDTMSFIFIKSTLFFILQCITAETSTHFKSSELFLKILIAFTNREANSYLAASIPSAPKLVDFNDIVQAIHGSYEFTIKQSDPESIENMERKFQLHMKYQTIPGFAKMHNQETNEEEVSYGSSIETMMAEIMKRDFPFHKLRSNETLSSSLELSVAPDQFVDLTLSRIGTESEPIHSSASTDPQAELNILPSANETDLEVQSKEISNFNWKDILKYPINKPDDDELIIFQQPPKSLLKRRFSTRSYQ